MELKLKSYDPFAYRINNVCDFDRSLVTAFKSNNKTALNVKLSLAEKKDYKVYICVNKSYHAFVLCAKSFKEDGDIQKDLSDVSRIELCFEDEKARMYKIRWRIEPYVNIRDNIRKVYFIGTFNDVSTIAFQCSALSASPDGYSVLVDDCVEFTKRFCKELVQYASNGNTIRTDVESQIRSATASGFTAEQLSREIRSSGYIMNTFLGDSKTDYDIYICIDKKENGFVMCVANVDFIDDPMLYSHFEHSENPSDIPALLFVSLFELSGDDQDLVKYKLNWRLAPFKNVQGQIKTSYFIGHIRNVSVVDLQCAALDASPKTKDSLSVDNIAFVKSFCKEILRYASNGQSQEKEFESQLNRVPDAGSARQDGNICKQLLTGIIDRFDVTTFGAGGIILVLVIMLIYPILVNWLLLLK